MHIDSALKEQMGRALFQIAIVKILHKDTAGQVWDDVLAQKAKDIVYHYVRSLMAYDQSGPPDSYWLVTVQFDMPTRNLKAELDFFARGERETAFYVWYFNVAMKLLTEIQP